MATQKQIDANRRNARLSTGPKTFDGKSISRRNSLVHGLSGAGTILPEDMRSEVAGQFSILAKTLRPMDQAEEQLVERMAVEAVRIVRCACANEKRAVKRQRRAVKKWDQRRVDR